MNEYLPEYPATPNGPAPTTVVNTLLENVYFRIAWLSQSTIYILVAVNTFAVALTHKEIGEKSCALVAGPPSPDVPARFLTPTIVVMMPVEIFTVRMTLFPRSEEVMDTIEWYGLFSMCV